MKLDRDISILTHIVDYCDQIKATIERFGEDRTVFASECYLPECCGALHPANW